MGKLVTVTIIGIIIIAGAVYLFMSPTPQSATVTVPVETSATNDGGSAPGAMVPTMVPSPGTAPIGTTAINPQSQNVTITYTDAGFSPNSISIPRGATVTWVNQSSRSMWVATNPHPSHTGYDQTSRSQHCATGYTGAKTPDECKSDAKGASYSFTFDKTGQWGYHNHVLANDSGTIIVTP